ncbi:MAG: Arc family DNA-binding protein [Crocinitomicaceae bacterium]
MSKKKSFVLRINPETFKLIEKWADDEFRSVNGQLEWMMTQSLKQNKRLKSKSKSEENDNDQ